MTGLEYPRPTRARQTIFAPVVGSFSTMPDSVQTPEPSGPRHCGQSAAKSSKQQKKTRPAEYCATVIVAGFNLDGEQVWLCPDLPSVLWELLEWHADVEPISPARK